MAIVAAFGPPRLFDLSRLSYRDVRGATVENQSVVDVILRASVDEKGCVVLNE